MRSLSGTPAVYTHVSAGSGKDVYVHFCSACGSKPYLTLARWPGALCLLTATLDSPSEVSFEPDTLRHLFLNEAQSGTLIPIGFRAYDQHHEPFDGSPGIEHTFTAVHEVTTHTEGTGPHTGGCLCGAVRYEAAADPGVDTHLPMPVLPEGSWRRRESRVPVRAVKVRGYAGHTVRLSPHIARQR